MPPKKPAAAKTDKPDADSTQKWSWSIENERKLLLLAIRPTIPMIEYHDFVKALPAGASYEGVRQKMQKLRREQREVFELHGLEIPGGKAVAASAEKTATPKGKKRAAEGEGVEKVVKKRKGGKNVAESVEEDEVTDDLDGLDGGVKEEDEGVEV